MPRALRSLAFAFVALATACSSGFSSGVDGSKPVSSLTDDEALTTCVNLRDYLNTSFSANESITFQCYVTALSDITADPTQCQAAFNACMASPPEPETITVECDSPSPDATCNATVSQSESCVTAFVETRIDWLRSVDCSIAGNVPELERIREQPPTPSECTSIESICPNAAGL